MKRPSFQFYPADWRKDAALQSCSLAAQGLWINLMCIAHECEPYGHLTINGSPMAPAQIGRLVGLQKKECEALIAELRDALVCDFTDGGVMFSRRMVRDERLRNTRAECGRLGGNPSLLGRKVKQKDNQATNQTPTPSSSSSASANTSVPNGTGAEAPTDRDLVFANGVALLTAAGVKESNARSFLAAQCKAHGEAAVLSALNRCASERPVQPVPWLTAALGPANSATKPRKSDALMAGNIAAAQRFMEKAQ